MTDPTDIDSRNMCGEKRMRPRCVRPRPEREWLSLERFLQRLRKADPDFCLQAEGKLSVVEIFQVL